MFRYFITLVFWLCNTVTNSYGLLSMKPFRIPSTAGSMLSQPAWKRVLLALGILVILWLAVVWAVAIP